MSQKLKTALQALAGQTPATGENEKTSAIFGVRENHSADVRGGEKRYRFGRRGAEPVEPVPGAHGRGSVRTLHQFLNLL